MERSIEFHITPKKTKLRCCYCGKKIKKDILCSKIYGGTTIYLCGENCLAEFSSDTQWVCVNCFDYVIREGKTLFEHFEDNK